MFGGDLYTVVQVGFKMLIVRDKSGKDLVLRNHSKTSRILKNVEIVNLEPDLKTMSEIAEDRADFFHQMDSARRLK